MYWAGKADLMVLYGLFSDNYKTKRATGLMSQMIVYAGFFFHLALLASLIACSSKIQQSQAEGIQRCSRCFKIHIQDPNVAVDTSCCSTLNSHTNLVTIYYWKLDNKQVTIQFRGGLLAIVIPAARVLCSCWQVFNSAGKKAHLADYQEFKGGYVAFGGRNGRITGKGKIKAGKLDFEDVYYVEELKHYNIFSVSQMCNKKNKVLFTDTVCLVLSPDFKLSDENQVLLKIPRQHNICTVSISRTLILLVILLACF
nr:putative ribonuclease H-like domain-containing protein [Tanacetum cinerariifolium]